MKGFYPIIWRGNSVNMTQTAFFQKVMPGNSILLEKGTTFEFLQRVRYAYQQFLQLLMF